MPHLTAWLNSVAWQEFVAYFAVFLLIAWVIKTIIKTLAWAIAVFVVYALFIRPSFIAPQAPAPVTVGVDSQTEILTPNPKPASDSEEVLNKVNE